MPEKKKAPEVDPRDEFLVFVFKNEKYLTRALEALVKSLRQVPGAKDCEVYRHHSSEVHVIYVSSVAMKWCERLPDLPRPRWKWTRKELGGIERDQRFP